MSLMEDLMVASKRHGVTCVVVGGNGTTYGAAHADPEFEGKWANDEEEVVEPSELAQLRAQVQALTAENQQQEAVIGTLRAAQGAAQAQAPAAAPAANPPGDNGSHRDQSVDVLGLEDEKLSNKLIRAGYDTVGKVADAYNEGRLAEMKLKKDWLIAVGMALSGLFARAGAPLLGAAPAPVSAATGPGVSDVPEGHQDRPWLERLGFARRKHKARAELIAQRDEVQQEYNTRVAAVKKAGNDPEDDEEVEQFDVRIIELEDEIEKANAHCIALRWSMGLEALPPEKSLDEALLEANLGPYCESPSPRVLPQ